MIKILHLELHDYCNGCPFRNDNWCTNSPNREIDKIKCGSRSRSIYPIPDWCPLSTWAMEIKF
jgi:hypothetical protein